MNETLLQIRKYMKSKKPVFIRQDNPKRPKLGDEWRKPKGIHSKIRHHFKGRRKMPSPGYKSPFEVRNLHTSGLAIVYIASVEDIAKINKEREGIVISKTVGARKRLEILRKAKEAKVKVLNLNIDESIKKIEEFINSKKKQPTEKVEIKVKKEEDALKPKESGISDDEKKAAEKREKDKILTKRV